MARKGAKKRTQQTEAEHALEVLRKIRAGSAKGAARTREMIAYARAHMPGAQQSS
jgi:hypothetical protein